VAALTGRALGTDGRPVVGAPVYVVSAPVAMADIAQLTNGEGRFDLEAPVPGSYTIGVSAADGSEGRVTIEVTEGDPPPAELTLAKSAQSRSGAPRGK
jgi:hypothetical protein